MTTIVDQIMVAIVAALTNATDAADRVYRSRVVAITRGETPCIAVAPHAEESTVFGQNIDNNILEVEVEVFVRGDPYDETADPVVGQVHRVLTNDPGIKSLVTEIRKKSKAWQAHEGDETAGVVATVYLVRYLSLAGDITAIV